MDQEILMENWKPKSKKNVKRDDKAYSMCRETTIVELERLLDIYRNTVFEDDMRARLYRDNIDHWIRRYHKYAIQGNIKSHYRQRNVSMASEDTIFEHVIPAANIRDMLIDEVITINQALNAPTCRISRYHNNLLNQRSLHDNNPNARYFFRRYITGMTENINGVDTVPEFETFNGQPITNLNTWSFKDHCTFFGIA